MFNSENKFEKIYESETTNYDMFNKYKGNRKVDDRRIQNAEKKNY